MSIMNYPSLNVFTDSLQWTIPTNTDVFTGYLSRLYP